MFYLHTDSLTEEVSLAKHHEDFVIFFAEGSPVWIEYQEWIAQGNTPEEWNNGLQNRM